NHNNDWWPWEQAGHILQGHVSGQACNWWNLDTALQDLDVAAELGTNAHRLSVEWSRIEPEPSVFSTAALDQYRALLEGMHGRGIEPMVTLHHFTNPQWLVEKGDFSSELVVEYFERYTRKVVEALGDLVPKWVTINEPMVYFNMRHLDKVFPQPPRPTGLWAGLGDVYHMWQCHAAAYHAIKAQQPQAQVGVAKNFPYFAPQNPRNPLDVWQARLLWRYFNDSWMQAMVTGRATRPFGRGSIKGLKDSFDFVGINYYSRYFVRFPKLGTAEWPEGTRLSDGNYGESYPEGLFQVIKYATQFNKPIYITENGVPDRKDTMRPAYLLSHLRQVWQAVCFNFPVMGYYHWSLIDNFEWERGWTQRFGLIEMDPETQVRQLRPSGRLYGEICRNYQINTTMVEKYAIKLLPQLFPGEAPASM
ncbi:MAG: glycoside hydrolase family 1 protein, partial [Anaerolineales bacterium]|nr:glycoside hydrolase family 1 protein [Anaerolineales bacterium]